LQYLIHSYYKTKNEICKQHVLGYLSSWKGNNMANKVRTSKAVAKKASKQLRSNTTSKTQKSVAASALRNRAKK
jgi:hypothetical protein